MLYNVVNFVLITVSIIIIIRCDRYREDFVERKFLAARFCLEWFGTKSRLKIKKKKREDIDSFLHSRIVLVKK